MSRIEEVKKIHDAMDEANAKLGDENKLCIFCYSTKYGGDGIIHRSDCPILIARQLFKRKPSIF